MADGNRIDYEGLVLHHSTGPDFYNHGDQEVMDWFSSVGYSRGYQNGALFPDHYYPGTNTPTYSMAQFAGRPYDADGNKYGYRVIPLMNDPFAEVAWQCGNWDMNCRTVGIENCGNYLDHTMPDKWLMCIADYFRSHDSANTRYWCHGEIFATQCPGQICSQRDKLVDMINNPAKWNAQLWPAPVPTPVPTPPPAPTQPEWQAHLTALPLQTLYALVTVDLVNLETGAKISSFAPLQAFDITGMTLVKGVKYYMTKYAVDHTQPNGLLYSALGDKVNPPTPPPAPPVPEPTPVDPVKPTPPIFVFIAWLWNKLFGKKK